MKYYPLYMDLRGRECLVVGAGAVAARKVRTLLDCGARVTVVGERPVEAMEELRSRGVKILDRKFRRDDLQQPALVIGATDSEEVNAEVSEESRRRGIPVNIVDDPAKSTFIVPALFRRGDVTMAVSTGGSSPALARLIRKDLARHYGEEYGELAALLGSWRERMMSAVSGHRRRADVWKGILDAGILDVLRREGVEGAEAIIRRHIDEAGERSVDR
jgi:precorrin-2 dehydrogenase/sirohydrochlorin ferrochelatase